MTCIYLGLAFAIVCLIMGFFDHRFRKRAAEAEALAERSSSERPDQDVIIDVPNVEPVTLFARKAPDRFDKGTRRASYDLIYTASFSEARSWTREGHEVIMFLGYRDSAGRVYRAKHFDAIRINPGVPGDE